MCRLLFAGPGLKVVCEYPNLQIKLGTDFDPDLHTVLVCKGTVILCFSGKGNDTPQVLKTYLILESLYTLFICEELNYL